MRQVTFDDPIVTNICFGGPDMKTAYVTLSGTGRLVAMDWPEPGLRLPYKPFLGGRPPIPAYRPPLIRKSAPRT